MSELVFLKFKTGERSLEFNFPDPDTGYIHKASNYQNLVREILVYRQNNNLEPIENLPQVLEDYFCRMACNAGKCQKDIALNRGYAAIWKGGILLLKNLLYKRFASQETAENRAKQCSTCKYNVLKNPDLLDIAAEKMVGKRSLPEELKAKTGNCAACGCNLRGKVFYDGEISPDEEELKAFQEVNCWQLGLPRE